VVYAPFELRTVVYASLGTLVGVHTPPLYASRDTLVGVHYTTLGTPVGHVRHCSTVRTRAGLTDVQV